MGWAGPYCFLGCQVGRRAEATLGAPRGMRANRPLCVPGGRPFLNGRSGVLPEQGPLSEAMSQATSSLFPVAYLKPSSPGSVQTTMAV